MDSVVFSSFTQEAEQIALLFLKWLFTQFPDAPPVQLAHGGWLDLIILIAA
jgi:hypothetical protein